MKSISIAFILSCILLTGCTDVVLNGPPIVSRVEMNTDSIHSYPGRYKIYLKSDHLTDPVFYSYERYNSGETLVPMSCLQSTIDGKTKAYLDTIADKNRYIEKIEMEKESMQRQLDEKNLLIRFLTGK